MSDHKAIAEAGNFKDKNHDLIKEVVELREKIKELEWFARQINQYVMPGETDTHDAALIAFKSLRAENEKLIQNYEELKSINDLTSKKITTLIVENDYLRNKNTELRSWCMSVTEEKKEIYQNLSSLRSICEGLMGALESYPCRCQTMFDDVKKAHPQLECFRCKALAHARKQMEDMK